MPVATFLIIFGGHVIILLIVKVNILEVIKWSYMGPFPNYVDYLA